MSYQHSHGVSNPHQEGDGSYMLDPNWPGLYRVPVKALNITWGNISRFWQWIILPEEETRSIGFKEGAMLVQVNWIEVTGKLSLSTFNVSLTTMYEVYYVVKFQVDAFGWHSAPIKFKVRTSGGDETVKSCILESYQKNHNVWHEIPGGEFTVSKDANGIVEFGMFEVESDWWKGCMVLAGIKIKPKSQLMGN